MSNDTWSSHISLQKVLGIFHCEVANLHQSDYVHLSRPHVLVHSACHLFLVDIGARFHLTVDTIPGSKSPSSLGSTKSDPVGLGTNGRQSTLYLAVCTEYFGQNLDPVAVLQRMTPNRGTKNLSEIMVKAKTLKSVMSADHRSRLSQCQIRRSWNLCSLQLRLLRACS